MRIPSGFRLDGRVVVITGASSGLGVGFARAVAAVGGAVVLGARRAERLGRSRTHCAARASRCAPGHRRRRSGRLHGLVDPPSADSGRSTAWSTTPASGSGTPASRETPDGSARHRHQPERHFWMAQACARVMTPGASIVNVSSALGLFASRSRRRRTRPARRASSGSPAIWPNSGRRRKGIRVNALCPGYFDTDILAGAKEQILGRRPGQQHPRTLRRTVRTRPGPDLPAQPGLVVRYRHDAGCVDGGMSAL